MRVDIAQHLMRDVVEIAQRSSLANNFRFVRAGLDSVQQHKAAFLLNYNDLSLGWKAANFFARSHEKLPVYLTADDHWIWRAYLVCCNPDLYFDRHVAEALAFLDPSMQHDRSTLEGYLIAMDTSIEEISQTTGIAADTIQAYEKLFFNVRDRNEDYLFLAKVVYPHGRLEEFYDNYLNNTTFGDLIRRAGYNTGSDYVSFMSGLRSKLVQDMSAGDMASKLEKVVMANGYVMAMAGLINQRENAAGLRTAQSMITAAKAGGNEQQDMSGFDDPGVAASLRDELSRVGRAAVRQNIAAKAELQGQYTSPQED